MAYTSLDSSSGASPSGIMTSHHTSLMWACAVRFRRRLRITSTAGSMMMQSQVLGVTDSAKGAEGPVEEHHREVVDRVRWNEAWRVRALCRALPSYVSVIGRSTT
jgi:hypothetical protein